MKRKILFAVSCIGVFSIGATIYADLAFSNTTSMLSDQEMAQSFGKCPRCTLGHDEEVEECLDQGSCPTCRNYTGCSWEYYPEGNYVYNCKNTGIEDGSCYEGELIDCKRPYYCDINGTWYSDRHCPIFSGGLCQSPAGSTDAATVRRGTQWAQWNSRGIGHASAADEVRVAVTESRCSVYEANELPLWMACVRSAVRQGRVAETADRLAR